MAVGRRGYFFTLDSILALFIIFAGLSIMSGIFANSQSRTQLNYYSTDIINMLAELKVGELNNSYLNELIANGNITDNDLTVLEQIGIFWVTNKTDLAIAIAENISSDLVPNRYGFEFRVSNDYVYGSNKTGKDEVVTRKSMISGIEKARPIKGTSARIYLHQISSTMTNKYIFLGGFVGQGNITAVLEGLPLDANITEMIMEVDAADNFSIAINSVPCGTFAATLVNMSSDAYDISACEPSLLRGTNNTFEFKFSGLINKSYIGGGFIKVAYYTKDIELKNTSSHRYDFPGISGIVNLYDGFVVPGELQDMQIYLHYLANHSNTSNNTFFLTIGNKTVWQDDYSNETMSVTLNNTYLSAKLDYASISNQTVPLRVGFENVSFEYIVTDKGNGDVVAVNDVSGSMEWEFDSTSQGIERFCRDPDLTNADTMRLALAKCVLKDFAGNILYNITGNRVGLVTYASSVRDSVMLETNLTSLVDAANRYYASGATCTTCGIVEAAKLLKSTDPVDLLSKKWLYTNLYPSSDPENWTQNDYDDSAWDFGYQNFGTGQGSDHYVGNVLQADLWEYPDDEPAPADFTSYIISTANTFGFMSVTSVDELIKNSVFSGPSLDSWDTHGSFELSAASNIFNDDFDDGNLDGWTLDPGRCSFFYWLTPSAEPEAQSSLSSGTYGALLTCGNDDDNDAASGSTHGRDPWISRAVDLSPYSLVRVSYSRASLAEGADIHDQGEDFRFEWTNDSWTTIMQEENIEMRNNLEDFQGDPIWQQQTYILPQGALSPDFEMRFSVDNSMNIEHGLVDDIVVQQVVANPFGLDDYWFVNSSSGFISQEFTSPTATPNEAHLLITHSINLSYFAGYADVFCNLTHPGGEETIWSSHWEGGTIPAAGPIEEDIDITSKITSSTFTYRLECGAVTSAGTIVAFDNVSVQLNWTNNGDDGWDWSQSVYDYPGNMIFYINNSGELEMSADRTAGDASGSYGIQVLISQDMVNAMNSAGGEAWLSFDYRWDSRDDGGDVFESDDQVWIKGFWESPASGQHFLGTETNSEDGDSTPEIWSTNDPDDEGSGRYSLDISSWIDDGAGYYYLALGGKLHRSQDIEFGSFSFDNIQLAFTNTSGNTFYRNEFFITDTNELHDPVSLKVTSDSGFEAYLNGKLLGNYTGAQAGRQVPVAPADFVDMDNILAIKLKNSDATARLFAEFDANITNRQKAMVVMSDGESNDCVGLYGVGTDGDCEVWQCGNRPCCPGSDGVLDEPCPTISAFSTCPWTGEYRRAAEQLVNITCYYAKQNTSIYTVAFGDVAECGKLALNLSALCDPDYTPESPHYFESDDPEGLSYIYGQIANELRLTFSIKQSQVLSFIGAYEQSYLYPDSYIYLSYMPLVQQMSYGEVPIFFESNDFGGCTSEIHVPGQLRVLEANLLSYSGDHWTDFVAVNNSAGLHVAFNLSRFNSIYNSLGDPFPIPIPGNYIKSGEPNTIIVNTGDSPDNSSNCSVNTTLFYTGLLNMINYSAPYSSVHANATGCNWTIEHELGFNYSIAVPTDYTGSAKCEYTNSSHNSLGFDNDDSFNWAMYDFLVHMDYNNDGRVFININSDDFIVNSRVVRDVPYLWGPTIAEVRVWQ